MSAAQPGNARQSFPQLDPALLQHPFDRRALSALQMIPGLDIAIRKFIELFPEKVAYIMNVAQSVRVSTTQCPRLYSLLLEACSILDMPVPELYIAQTPLVNAMTSGHNHPYIIVHSGMIDLLTDEEVLAVLAHELGHIKSGHVLYKTMARAISMLLQLIGDLTLGIGRLIGFSLEAALLEWDRMAEFSADRFSLAVVQDPQVVLSLMMKLAGGTLFQRHEMNASEFLAQAELYQAVDINLLDRLYKALLVAPTTHPMLVVRASEIVKWSDSREYRDMLEGRYPHAGAHSNNPEPPTDGPITPSATEVITESEELIVCPHCHRAQSNRVYCSFCGGEIV